MHLIQRFRMDAVRVDLVASQEECGWPRRQVSRLCPDERVRGGQRVVAPAMRFSTGAMQEDKGEIALQKESGLAHTIVNELVIGFDELLQLHFLRHPRHWFAGKPQLVSQEYALGEFCQAR